MMEQAAEVKQKTGVTVAKVSAYMLPHMVYNKSAPRGKILIAQRSSTSTSSNRGASYSILPCKGLLVGGVRPVVRFVLS